MTNITGKIYQETNDDGTENRFPKTVVPAVIGLSQYLQDQFNTLSDLYMPKEGESESKTGQEITYRKSEATINAKTVTIDRIYGKTLVWNQLISMSSLSTNSCSKTTNSDGAITATPSGTGTYALFDNAASSYMLNCPSHKYYIASDIKSTGGAVLLGRIYYVGTAPSGKAITITPTTSFARYSFILTGVPAGTVTGVVALSGNIPTDFTIKNFIVVNLTLLYGSEIDGMTDAQILAKFESEFPGYHSYEPGKLISNDAESIEIVGFNQCDENNFEPGAIGGGSGWNASGYDDKRVRSRDYIKCLSNTNYYANFVRNTYSSYVRIFWYDSEKKFIVQTNNNGISTSPLNAKYMRVQTEGSDYGGTYKNDIVVNISDTDKNGQYEPHYKSELKLNLNSIKVKSHNIWDEEWDLKNRELNGSESASSSYLTNKNPIKALPNTEYYFYSEHPTRSDRQVYYLEWNSSLSLITRVRIDSSLINASNSRFAFRKTTSSSAEYIGLFIYSGTAWSDTDISNSRLCVNISSSFNGFYEPHGTITVNGLNASNGLSDEIIGNKLIKRFGKYTITGQETISAGSYSGNSYFVISIPNTEVWWASRNDPLKGRTTKYVTSINANTGITPNKTAIINTGYVGKARRLVIKDDSYSYDATGAANLLSNIVGMEVVYELGLDDGISNYQEYELAEPLTYTFKAGTTEERISPNSDGLSAPFCCDLTYNASETAGVLDALQGLSRKLELIEERLARLEDNE